jgi:hypothetical protein
MAVRRACFEEPRPQLETFFGAPPGPPTKSNTGGEPGPASRSVFCVTASGGLKFSSHEQDDGPRQPRKNGNDEPSDRMRGDVKPVGPVGSAGYFGNGENVRCGGEDAEDNGEGNQRVGENVLLRNRYGKSHEERQTTKV